MKKNNIVVRIVYLVILILFTFFRIFFSYKDFIYRNKVLATPLQVEFKPKKEEQNTDEYFELLVKLHAKNPDTYGYLIIPGTKVNYPVMYTKGKDYYLRKSFQKLYSIAGTLYIDKYNSIAPRDDNLIIYGHNMDNGTMFADILKYKNKAFFTGHQNIIFYTLNGKEEYKIVSTFISKVYTIDDNVFKYYKQYNFNNDKDFNHFKDNINALKLYDTSTDIDISDAFITLSTCEYTEKNGRFVVVAKRI